MVFAEGETHRFTLVQLRSGLS